MARKPRIDAPGVAQHVVQRGINRQNCFQDDTDRWYYLASLREAAMTFDCAIHSYVLMSNHVHLLVTGAQKGSVSRMMQSLGRRYVRRYNDRHCRSGTLWEGRFKAGLVDSDRYLITCYRYIEMNPVRARMVGRATDYPWSSVHHNAVGQTDFLVTPHPTYLAISHEESTRLGSYRALLDIALTDDELTNIRGHTKQCKVIGSERFKREMMRLTRQDVRYRRPGRAIGS